MRHILPCAKRIRCCAPVSPQIFIITSWKDSRQRASGSKKEQVKGEWKKRAGVSDREALYEYKQSWLMQSKIDERRTEKNGGLHGVMPRRTVKSSSQGWSTHSSSVNPSVSVLSSPTIHSFTHLYLCFSDEDKGKHSLICSLLPQFSTPLLSPFLGLFRQGLQAWLAIVTWPHGGKIGTHAQTHTCIHIHTYVAKRRTRASFARSNYPLSKAQRHWGGWRGGGNFAFSNVSHRSQYTRTQGHLRKCICLEAKRLGCFLVLVTMGFFFSDNMLIWPSQVERRGGKRGHICIHTCYMTAQCARRDKDEQLDKQSIWGEAVLWGRDCWAKRMRGEDETKDMVRCDTVNKKRKIRLILPKLWWLRH